MMTEDELGRALGDITDTVVTLQRHIDRICQIFAASGSRLSSSSPTPTSSRSLHGRSISPLERRIEELESNKRDLTDTLSTIQDEVHNAVRAREAVMKRYRLLIRFSTSLLQRMVEDFPDEEYDEELRSAVREDLKRSLRSSSSGTSRSSTTARPGSRATNRSSVASARSHPLNIAARGASPSALLNRDHTPEDNDPTPWLIHTGTRIPASVKYAAGPLSEDSFVGLGIEKNTLEELFLGLIHPKDVTIRLAMLPSPPGLEDLKFVFLYDPFYLESGTRSYIIDWTTPQTKKEVVKFLRDNVDRDGNTVFQTFTYSKKKKHWYYFGSLKWTRDRQSIWSTLDDESRSFILKKLGDRSHGSVVTGDIEKEMSDGNLKELIIDITSTGSIRVMRDIATKLGQQLREAKARKSG